MEGEGKTLMQRDEWREILSTTLERRFLGRGAASFGGMLKVLLINLTLVQKLRILLHGDVDIIGIDFES